MDLQNGDANNVDSNGTDAASGDAKPVDTKLVDASGVSPKISERSFRQINRRELLKLTPVIALGAFAIPALREPLLKRGLRFSDWASGKLFRSGQLAPTFADSAVTPLEKFPLNGTSNPAEHPPHLRRGVGCDRALRRHPALGDS